MNITEKKNAGKYYSAAYYLDGCGPDYMIEIFGVHSSRKLRKK